MNQKFLSKKTAKWLMACGAVGFVGSLVISLVAVFNIYHKAGDCFDGCKTASLTSQLTVVRIAVVIAYLSVAAIIVGLLIIVAVKTKAKRIQPQIPAQPTTPQPNKVKHLVIRVLACIAAFFISTSIADTIVADSVMKASSKTVEQQGHIFAYIIIFVFPLVGGFSVYFTNKYLKKRLG